MTIRQQDEIRKIEFEIRELTDSLRHGSSLEFAEISKRLQELDKRKEEIKRASFFICDYIYPAIAFLVSLIEGKDYVHKEVTIPTADLETVIDKETFLNSKEMLKLKKDGYLPYRISFLCENPKQALDDINVRINDLFNAQDPRRMLNEILLLPSEDYVQLTFYKPSLVVEFNNNFSIDNNVNNYANNESKIVDGRFFYIIDFMDYLTDICMTLGRKLSGEEMMMYAEEFARRYNLEKEANARK